MGHDRNHDHKHYREVELEMEVEAEANTDTEMEVAHPPPPSQPPFQPPFHPPSHSPSHPPANGKGGKDDEPAEGKGRVSVLRHQSFLDRSHDLSTSIREASARCVNLLYEIECLNADYLFDLYDPIRAQALATSRAST